MRVASELLLIDSAEIDLSKVQGLFKTLVSNAPEPRRAAYQAQVDRLANSLEELANTRKELADDPGTDC